MFSYFNELQTVPNDSPVFTFWFLVSSSHSALVVNACLYSLGGGNGVLLCFFVV